MALLEWPSQTPGRHSRNLDRPFYYKFCGDASEDRVAQITCLHTMHSVSAWADRQVVCTCLVEKCLHQPERRLRQPQVLL